MRGGLYGDNSPKDICVPTIMHSGTHLLRYVVLRARGKTEPELAWYDDWEDTKYGTPRMRTFHLTECKDNQQYIANLQVFTSLRHPRRIRESFRRRQDVGNHARYPYNQETFDWQWREMIDNISKHDPIYLHVDDEVRDKEVALIAKAIDKPCVADWAVGKESGSVTGTHDIAIDDCPEVPQEYIDFYFDTI